MSPNVVYYHLPDDDQFSLDFVNPDSDVIDDRLEKYDEVTETQVRSYDLDETVYVIYTKTNEVTDTENIEYTFDSAFAEMDPNTRMIVRYYLALYQAVQERKHDEEGVPLDAYKDVEIERVPDALAQVDWTGTIPEVGGRVASNFVLCHALPNANHRTSFALLEEYVKAAHPSFELPSLIDDDYEWLEWVDEFIVDSKRLLTVRRNVGPFQYLSEFGCDTIRRKGGIDIPLSGYNLDVRPYEALSAYARQHERRTVTFATTILQRSNYDNLVSEPGIEKDAFADYVRRLF